MRCLALALLLTACGSTAPVPATAPAPDAGVPDAEPIGAMPIPADDFWSRPPSLDELDTTVTLDELLAIRDWPKAVRIDKGGEVMLALHVDRDDVLRLSIVEDNTGIVTQFPLAGASHEIANHTFDGNTYPSPESGPILFAIRALPHPDADESDRYQLAIFTTGTTLRIAHRWPATGPWTAVHQITFPKRTTFRGIGTTYPH